jgi:hypothetical protein
VVPGGEDVRQHHVVGLALGGVLAQAQGHEVAVRHTQQFGLPALVGTHVGEPEGRSGEGRFGLHGEAVVAEAAFAVLAESAGDVERQHDVLADLHLAYGVPDLDDLAHVLVAEGPPGLEARPALVHVQVGSADVGGGDADENVVRVFDPGVRHIGDGDVLRTLVHDCLHGDPSWCGRWCCTSRSAFHAAGGISDTASARQGEVGGREPIREAHVTAWASRGSAHHGRNTARTHTSSFSLNVR